MENSYVAVNVGDLLIYRKKYEGKYQMVLVLKVYFTSNLEDDYIEVINCSAEQRITPRHYTMVRAVNFRNWKVIAHEK